MERRMNGRERFRKIAGGEAGVFLPYNLNYAWFMDETLDVWADEGMPQAESPREFFGLDEIRFGGGAPYTPFPAFEEQIISEDAETRVVRDSLGLVKRVYRENENSKMPQWLEFPIGSRADFREFARRLDPDSPERFGAGWERLKEDAGARDYPLGVAPGSFYGHTLQRWVGTENLCMLFYDDPSFVHEMMEYLEGFFLALVQRAVEDVEFDFASFGEDIAFKGRAFMSPAMFREFIQPHYVSITEVLRSNGVETVFVDSDGYVDELIPMWMEVGINGFSPLEVAAGTDAEQLKSRYGNDIVLAGNIDKRALAAGGGELEREIDKARRLCDSGGYFPAVDHSVPPDVPMANFRHLVESLRAG
jgi:hypothetical protein